MFLLVMPLTMSDEPMMFGRDWHMGERVVYRPFTCACCQSEFMTASTEAEMNREYLESGQPTTTGISSVCDACYKFVMSRAREDGLL